MTLSNFQGDCVDFGPQKLDPKTMNKHFTTAFNQKFFKDVYLNAKVIALYLLQYEISQLSSHH